MKLGEIMEDRNSNKPTWREFIAKYTDGSGRVKPGYELTWNDDHESLYRIGHVEVEDDDVSFGDIAARINDKWRLGDWDVPTDVHNEHYFEKLDEPMDVLFSVRKTQ